MIMPGVQESRTACRAWRGILLQAAHAAFGGQALDRLDALPLATAASVMPARHSSSLDEHRARSALAAVEQPCFVPVRPSRIAQVVQRRHLLIGHRVFALAAVRR